MSRTLKISRDLALPLEAVTELQHRIRDNSPVDAAGSWICKLSLKNGYGQITIGRRRNFYSHHVSYMVFVARPIPEGMNVCHSCDVKRCNNPEHFFLGTQLDNLADMRAKGRGSPPPHSYGMEHYMAKLSDEQVAEIRARWALGRVEQRELAAHYGCSQSTIWRLIHGVTRGQAHV